MTTLHLGTFEPLRLVGLLPSDRLCVVWGRDSWEEWGEPLADHPDHPDHIMVSDSETTSSALLGLVVTIEEAAPGLLMPLAYRSQAGTLGTVTPDDDWSEPIRELIDTQAQRFIHRHYDGDTSRLAWTDSRWREFLDLRIEDGRKANA